MIIESGILICVCKFDSDSSLVADLARKILMLESEDRLMI